MSEEEAQAALSKLKAENDEMEKMIATLSQGYNMPCETKQSFAAEPVSSGSEPRHAILLPK